MSPVLMAKGITKSKGLNPIPFIEPTGAYAVSDTWKEKYDISEGKNGAEKGQLVV